MYSFVTCNNHVVTDNNPLTHRYFTHLKNGNVAANNGFFFLRIKIIIN